MLFNVVFVRYCFALMLIYSISNNVLKEQEPFFLFPLISYLFSSQCELLRTISGY